MICDYSVDAAIVKYSSANDNCGIVRDVVALKLDEGEDTGKRLAVSQRKSNAQVLRRTHVLLWMTHPY